MAFLEEELLALSGIQHFAFCERQWALIHIERQWEENVKTIEGKHLHQNVDNPDFLESRGGIITTRSLPLVSYHLGFYGVADVVEFHRDDDIYGINLKGRNGLWLPVPVEYKRGKPKKDDIDEVQLCAQALCLEEMMKLQLERGYIYYGETKRRTTVVFNDLLRARVKYLANEMHRTYQNKLTPKANYKKVCKSCSLINTCLPKISSKYQSVKSYLRLNLSDEEV